MGPASKWLLAPGTFLKTQDTNIYHLFTTLIISSFCTHLLLQLLLAVFTDVVTINTTENPSSWWILFHANLKKEYYLNNY